MPLYSELMEVSERDGGALRRFFLGPCRSTTRGVFDVRCGESLIARMIHRILGFPSPGVSTPLELTVVREGNVEHWRRDFQGHILESVQYRVAERWMAERFGLVEILFRLEVRDGGLRHIQERTCVRMGPVRLPLPRWLAPRVSGLTEIRAGDEKLRAAVTMNLPWGALLLAYEGVIESAG